MVLKYETMTEDERRTDRLDRHRWREGWERNTIERRFCYTAATMVALALEDQEDNVLKLVAVDFAGKDAVLQGMRRTATDLQKIYLQLETASKYGFNISEKFFDRKSAVQGLTEEQEKLLKAIIKEEGGETGGSKSKKAKLDSGKEEPKAGGSGGGAGPGWGDGGAGPGWGYAPPFPYAQPNMGSFAAGYPGMMMGGWPAPPNQGFGGGAYGGGGQYGMAGQQGFFQQGGGYGQGGVGGNGYSHGGAGGGGTQGGAGSSGRGAGNGAGNNKRRYPCDNCGSMEHWKYEVVCPKYHLHLEQLAAKHAGARGQQAGAAGGQQGPHLALPPPPPGKNLVFMSFKCNNS
jgi:hypothetical protein